MTRTLPLALLLSACVAHLHAAGDAVAIDDGNETAATAALASVGAAIEGTVHTGHARYYALDLHAGEALEVDARTQVLEHAYGNGVYALELDDAAGGRVAATALVPSNGRDPVWDPYQWKIESPGDGRYYLRIANQSAAAYPKTLRYQITIR